MSCGGIGRSNDIVKVSCKPLGHHDSEPYPSEEIVRQFFKEVLNDNKKNSLKGNLHLLKYELKITQ